MKQSIFLTATIVVTALVAISLYWFVLVPSAPHLRKYNLGAVTTRAGCRCFHQFWPYASDSSGEIR